MLGSGAGDDSSRTLVGRSTMVGSGENLTADGLGSLSGEDMLVEMDQIIQIIQY